VNSSTFDFRFAAEFFTCPETAKLFEQNEKFFLSDVSIVRSFSWRKKPLELSNELKIRIEKGTHRTLRTSAGHEPSRKIFITFLNI